MLSVKKQYQGDTAAVAGQQIYEGESDHQHSSEESNSAAALEKRGCVGNDLRASVAFKYNPRKPIRRITEQKYP